MTSISVVIPVKDDATMLAACLGALDRQTRPPDEVVVVDNDGADDGAEMARRWGATVITEREPGIWAAAAAGYDAASGDLIARLDADSVPRPDWLERVERAMVARPDAVAISGSGYFYDLAAPARVVADLVYTRMYFQLMRVALGNRTVFGSNFAMRAPVWRRVAGSVHRHDAEVHDDMDLGYHLEPGWEVLFDRSIAVGISGRPFTDLGSMVRRTRRAVRTVLVHGPWDWPPSRWFRLATLRMVRFRRRHSVFGPVAPSVGRKYRSQHRPRPLAGDRTTEGTPCA